MICVIGINTQSQGLRDSNRADADALSHQQSGINPTDDLINENTQHNNNINSTHSIKSLNGQSITQPPYNANVAIPTTNPITSNTTSSPQLTKQDLLKPIATLSDTPLSARSQLLVHKLKLCCISFDWSSIDDNPNSKDNKARESKRQQLLELVEYIGKNKNIYTELVLSELMQMVQSNLFRALPARQNESVANKTGGGEGDEDDPIFDPSWSHLQIVYELFLRFIVGSEVDMKVLKKWINAGFIVRLLDLFDSEDHRERDYLKTILHRIYAKFMSLRAFVRKAINHVFFIFVYETERHNGISELLEILGSIINGFALPLKTEHKTFLRRVLLPLHSARNLQTFHQQLAYCVAQFVDKDPTLAAQVLTHLCKYWPHQTAQKQLLFLNELEELLELCQADQFKLIATTLTKRLSSAIASPHFQVAERALFLWHNEYVANLIADHRNIVLPILYPTLYTNSQPPAKPAAIIINNNNAVANNNSYNANTRSSIITTSSMLPAVHGHWNPTVNSLTVNVLKIFADLDQPLLDQCSKQYIQQQQLLHTTQQQYNNTWAKIDAAHKNNHIIKQIELIQLSATESLMV